MSALSRHMLGELDMNIPTLSTRANNPTAPLNNIRPYHIPVPQKGSLARLWVGSMVANRLGSKFPYGTFVINITA